VKRGLLLLAVLAGLALGVLSFIPRAPEDGRSWTAGATTYSPGPGGAKAFFLLLKGIGLETQRSRQSSYNQLPPETTLWVLTREPFGRAERRDLVAFLKKGGTLVAPPQALAVVLEEAGLGKEIESTRQAKVLRATWGMSLDLEGTPTSLSGVSDPVESYANTSAGLPVVAAWQVGEGRAVALGADELVRNERIGRADNGLFLGRLALSLGEKHAFDEFKTGFGEGDLVSLVASAPYRWGVAQLLLVGAVGLFSFARRRLPAEAPGPARRRRVLDHVDAVARLWEQANDAGLPLQAIVDAVEERARLRLGGGGDKPFIEWIGHVRPALLPRAKEAWQHAQRLCLQLPTPSDEARRIAAEIKTLEREGLKW
jgi:hypothetical protein